MNMSPQIIIFILYTVLKQYYQLSTCVCLFMCSPDYVTVKSDSKIIPRMCLKFHKGGFVAGLFNLDHASVCNV